jgi:hypothetical protein
MAPDAEAGQEPHRRDRRDRPCEGAEYREHSDEGNADDEQGFAAKAIAERAGRQRSHQDPDARHDECSGEKRRRDAPCFRERWCGHSDRAQIEAVEGLHQCAKQDDTQLQRTEWLVLKRLFNRRFQFTGHRYPPCGFDSVSFPEADTLFVMLRTSFVMLRTAENKSRSTESRCDRTIPQ